MGDGRRLLRAAGYGATLALLLGGAYVLIQGLVGTFGSPDCAALSAAECGFLRESARAVGRLQLIFGGAMVALSIAVYALRRPTGSEQKETTA